MKAVIALECSKVALVGPPFLGHFHSIGKHECQPSCVASSFYVWGCGWGAMCFLALWWLRGRFGCWAAAMPLGLWWGLRWGGCTCWGWFAALCFCWRGWCARGRLPVLWLR